MTDHPVPSDRFRGRSGGRMPPLSAVLLAWLTGLALTAWSAGSRAAELNLATSPLFLGTSVDANVFFQLDDSGSMDWEVMTRESHYYANYWRNAGAATMTAGLWDNTVIATYYSYYNRWVQVAERREFAYLFDNEDNLYAASHETAETRPDALTRDWRARSADFNLIYYNPELTYRPWPGMPDASFTAARSNPRPGTAGYDDRRDLTGFVFEVWSDDHGYGGNRPDGPGDATDGPNGKVDLWDSHTAYTVSTDSLNSTRHSVPDAATMAALDSDCTLADASDSVPYADCFGTTLTSASLPAGGENAWGRTLAQEKQNVANWYQYYRRRSFVAKAAVSQVVDGSGGYRYGLSLINDHDALFIEVPGADVDDYTSHNQALMDALFDYEWQALGTPLRRGLERVGQYYDSALSGKADPIISACQQNFTVLISDGAWSGDAPARSIGDADGDGHSRTLADVAKYYYDKDLSPLPNDVPTSVIDGNNQQHMVTFTVAFGLTGRLEDTDNDGYPNPPLAVDGDWGNPLPVGNDLEKIDDLWHAAYNSKGRYVAAQTPSALVMSLSRALSEITDRVGSSASVATNSGSLHEGSKLFQARFDSADWSGELIAFDLNEDGSLRETPAWRASDILDSQHPLTGRTIVTWNPELDVEPGGDIEGAGVPFRFPLSYRSPNRGELNLTQVGHLLAGAPHPLDTEDSGQIAANQSYGEALLAFLRGARGDEATGQGFRRRGSVLGDLVDSDPRFVGMPRFRYRDDMETDPYSAFQAHYAERPRMVYVGGNDGMLHGFDEDDGRERLAFVPNTVFEHLPALSDREYLHRHYVNAAPTVVDAFLPNASDPVDARQGAWRTVLAGGLGGGGQAVYALDVTDPARFSEANAADLVLWEFSDDDDADLGYTYGEPSIVRMANGKWAAVFGNGYNNTEADGNASATGRAALYVVDIETGSLIRKIMTPAGSVDTPNGLASPAVTDIDGDQVADFVYAGDLRGNVWKFDVTGTNPSQWGVAYKQGSTPIPLFSTGPEQPITTRPQVTRHPANLGGYMVYFGTGKYLEVVDNSPSGADTQAFYGIWDKAGGALEPFGRDALLQQHISNQYSAGFDTSGDGTDDTFYGLRDVTDHAIDFSRHMGWFMELRPEQVDGEANSANFGEKQVSNAVVRDGRVIFTTLVPSQGPCDFGGSSFLMELDYRNGGRLHFPAFDLNGDGLFDAGDGSASGKMAQVGIVPTVSILSNNDREIAYGSGSSGDVDVTELNIGTSYLGRQSWRQLR